MIKKVIWLMVVAGTVIVIHAAESYDVSNEIARTKRELKRQEQEREKVRKATAEDKKEFDEYTARTRQRFTALAAETDSVRQATGAFQQKSDSLGAVLGNVKTQHREFDLKQKGLRDRLVELCDEAIKASALTTPMLSRKSSDALSFLKSELASGTVDNIEGMNRFVQILNDLDLQLMEIQIGQGASPLTEIQGAVYQLRIGGVLEAVVDMKGEKGAVWSGGEKGGWVLIDDPVVAARVLKAVEIREGKTLPAFVVLPFSATQGGQKDE